eukprot:SAG22_NODE_1642_length_3908_cov_3.850092_4_plen_287_part_00
MPTTAGRVSSEGVSSGRAPYPRAGKALRITITEWDVRRPGDFLRVYDGASVISPRVGAFDGADRVQAGTVYALSGEALLHWHVDPAVWVENEDTGIMEQVYNSEFDGPDREFQGFELEFEVVEAATMVPAVAERGDGFLVDLLVENTNLSSVPPETVIAFPNASLLNMSASDWKLWQQAAVYNVTTNWTVPTHPSTGPAGKYECLLAWREWVAPACCPHFSCAQPPGPNGTGSALPPLCSAFCAPTYVRWFRACNGTLQLREPDANGTRHAFLDPAVHANLTAFYR